MLNIGYFCLFSKSTRIVAIPVDGKKYVNSQLCLNIFFCKELRFKNKKIGEKYLYSYFIAEQEFRSLNKNLQDFSRRLQILKILLQNRQKKIDCGQKVGHIFSKDFSIRTVKKLNENN